MWRRDNKRKIGLIQYRKGMGRKEKMEMGRRVARQREENAVWREEGKFKGNEKRILMGWDE